MALIKSVVCLYMEMLIYVHAGSRRAGFSIEEECASKTLRYASKKVDSCQMDVRS